MSILTIIMLVVAFLVILLLIAASLSNKQYSIEKEVIINKPLPVVFDYIRYLKNHDFYNKWVMMDPASKKDYRGTDGTVGFVYAWDSQNKSAGKGEQEITKITEGERVDYVIRFEKPFKGNAIAYLSSAAVSPGQTKVTWGFAGERNFVMRIFHIMFNLKKILGKDLLASLQNLKKILEK